MQTDHRTRLSRIQDFGQLVDYLRDEMDWPIDRGSFDDDAFEYSPEELGIDAKNAAKIQEIKRLRPFYMDQPWRIFFVRFEPKHLPVGALRRILSRFAGKRSGRSGFEERGKWEIEDLLFVSICGQDEQRRITFAHFTSSIGNREVPALRVLDWDNKDTPLHLDHVTQQLRERLAWPSDQGDIDAWRKRWGEAFTVQHRHTVNTSRDLSVRLAELARDIRERIKAALEVETEKGYIAQLLKSFQETLVHDIDHDGFADMVAQTITYGLLSARITDPKRSTAIDLTYHMRTNPLLSDLMAVFLNMGARGNEVDFDELGVVEVEEFLTDTDMESVVRDFGDRNPREDPVIHFYENFLAEYDKEQKVKRGVFYTPRPVVSYIVNSIDTLLRSEFGLTDGLADTSSWSDVEQKNENFKTPDNISPESDFVQILDPATGTGTFLVEVIELIYSTLKKKWHNQGHSEERIASLWNEYVPKHLLSRLYGYELMMAPYVIAHFKISLKLYETGYRFSSNERARIYLTNSLEPAKDSSQLVFNFAILALANEAREVDDIKRAMRFTVVLGNPPYSGESANKGKWIRKLLRGHSGKESVENYFSIEGEPLRERNPKWLNDDYVKFTRFAHWQIERTGQGIIGFITNHSYLDNPTFRGMRESLTSTFSTQYLLDLHGNAKKKEHSPDGNEDQNVFDIQQGVAIGLFVKSAQIVDPLFNQADLWGKREQIDGKGKYDFLEKNNVRTTKWEAISPVSPYWFFIPHNSKLWNEYKSGWKLTDIFPVNSVGIVTARDKLTIQFTEEEMKCVVEKFVDLDTEDARRHYELNKDTRDWKVKLAQEDIKDRDGEIYPILYRPFDTRFTYYSGKSRGFICMPRPKVMRHMLRGRNVALVFSRQTISGEGPPVNVMLSNTIVDGRAVFTNKGIAQVAPLYLYPEQNTLQEKEVNIGPNIRGEINELGKHPEYGTPSEMAVFDYVYGILHCPAYRSIFSECLKQDFPCIPKPTNAAEFWDISSKGRKLRRLHLMDDAVLGDAPYTFTGEGNAVVEVPRFKNGRILINKTQGFENVSEVVWNCYIGGFRPAHKWLKDRKGRKLKFADLQHYQRILKILAETIRVMEEITITLPALKKKHQIKIED